MTVTRASGRFLEHREKQQQAESGTVGAKTRASCAHVSCTLILLLTLSVPFLDEEHCNYLSMLFCMAKGEGGPK